MAEKGLRQADLAGVLGVSIDRVKSLTSGRVTKLTPAETKALVEKLHVRGDYLATGTGPIFQTEPEAQFDLSMQLLKEASTTVQSLDLPPRYQMFVRDLLFAVALKKAEFILITIEQFLAEQRADPQTESKPTSKSGKRKT